ncbi:MAG: peptidase S8, partial [Chloroflexus sp.]
NVITTTVSSHTSAYIVTAPITNTEIKTYSINHAGGSLKCTLAWDDVPATLPASQTLVNNLDLALIAPDNTMYSPWVLDKNNPANAATTGLNTVDTVEQVVVADAVAGEWTVRVTGSSVPQGPQTFSLVCPFAETAVTSVSVFVPLISR